MSILRGIIGGALEGIGTGMIRHQQVKDQREGERLRHEYAMARMKLDQDFRSDQAEKDRLWRTSEAEAGRKHQELLTDKGIEARADLQDDQQAFIGDQNELNRIIEQEKLDQGWERLELSWRQLDLTEQEMLAKIRYWEAQADRWEGIADIEKAKFAQEMAMWEAQKEAALKQGPMPAFPPMKPGDVQSMKEYLRETGQFSRIDEETGEEIVDDKWMEAAASWSQRYHESTGRWMPTTQYQVTVQDVLDTMKEENMSLTEVLHEFKQMRFGMPDEGEVIARSTDSIVRQGVPASTRQRLPPILGGGRSTPTSPPGRPGLLRSGLYPPSPNTPQSILPPGL